MDWLEFSVTTSSETAEAVVELFNRYGRGGAVVEVPVDCYEHDIGSSTAAAAWPAAANQVADPPSIVIVKTYLPLDGDAEQMRQRLEQDLQHLRQIYPIPGPVVRELAEEDWAEAWKEQYHLLRAGERTVIVPAWEEYTAAPGEAVVRMEPGMAFGTGLHATTHLCLEALEAHLIPGCAVLDVGTGSGVLSIAAAKLGARTVLALDTDPVAIAVARENIVLNGVTERVAVELGSLPSDTPGERAPVDSRADGALHILEAGHFDLALVNILARVIIAMVPALAVRLKRGGRLIAAGLVEAQENGVLYALQADGLNVIERTQEQGWVCLVAQRE